MGFGDFVKRYWWAPLSPATAAIASYNMMDEYRAAVEGDAGKRYASGSIGNPDAIPGDSPPPMFVDSSPSMGGLESDMEFLQDLARQRRAANAAVLAGLAQLYASAIPAQRRAAEGLLPIMRAEADKGSQAYAEALGRLSAEQQALAKQIEAGAASRSTGVTKGEPTPKQEPKETKAPAPGTPSTTVAPGQYGVVTHPVGQAAAGVKQAESLLQSQLGAYKAGFEQRMASDIAAQAGYAAGMAGALQAMAARDQARARAASESSIQNVLTQGMVGMRQAGGAGAAGSLMEAMQLDLARRQYEKTLALEDIGRRIRERGPDAFEAFREAWNQYGAATAVEIAKNQGEPKLKDWIKIMGGDPAHFGF